MSKSQRRDILQARAEKIADTVRNKHDADARHAEKNKPKNKIWNLRMKLLQRLTEANKAHPEQREENTKRFIDYLVSFVVKEFEMVSKMEVFTLKKLTEFVNNYSAHINNLIIFDNEMVFSENPQSNESMVERFNKEIERYIPVLLSRFINVEMEREDAYRVQHSKENNAKIS